MKTTALALLAFAAAALAGTTSADSDVWRGCGSSNKQPGINDRQSCLTKCKALGGNVTHYCFEDTDWDDRADYDDGCFCCSQAVDDDCAPVGPATAPAAVPQQVYYRHDDDDDFDDRWDNKWDD